MTTTFTDVVKQVIPKRPEPFPRWLIEEYPGSEQDRADTIFATVYWKMREEREAKALEAGQEIDFDKPSEWSSQLEADALNRATVIANENKEGFDRAFLVLSDRVNKTGSYRFAKGEYDSFEEWVVDNITSLSDREGAELSNFMYYHNELLPMISQVGGDFTPDQMLAFTEYKAKGFAAIPYLREKTTHAKSIQIYYEEEIVTTGRRISKLEAHVKTLTKEEAKPYEEEIVELEEKRVKLTEEAPIKIAEAYQDVVKTVEKTIELMKDPSVPAWNKVNGIQNQLKRGKSVTFKGSKFYVTDSDNGASAMFLINVPTPYEKAVESMLRNFIDFSISDGQVLVDMAKAVTKGKDKLSKKEEE